MFPYKSLCKTYEPRAGPFLAPRIIILTNLVEIYLVMLHTKYQGSRPNGFHTRRLFMLS